MTKRYYPALKLSLKLKDQLEEARSPKAEQDLEFLRFQLNEIEQAQLKPGEDEELEAIERRIAAREKIYQRVAESLEILDGEQSTVPQLYEAAHRPETQEVDRYSEEVDLATGEGWTDELQGSQSKRDAPTDSELAEAVAGAEAALRQGVDPSDIAAEERAADADAGNVVASATKVEAAGHAKGDVDTSGESCALEAGGVPEHLDYRVWNVAYADGTSVRFDSVLGEALLD